MKKKFLWACPCGKCFGRVRRLVRRWGVYFALQPLLGRETVSWVCIVAAVPFAAAGFFSYDGMTVWQFLQTALETEVLYSGVRVWAAGNKFYDRQYKAKPHKTQVEKTRSHPKFKRKGGKL